MANTDPPLRAAHLLPVVAAWDETPLCRGLRVSGPPALLAQYQVPGQYLEVEDGSGTRSYFALAAAPDGQHLELLVRRGSAMADVLCAMEPGPASFVPATCVLGKGYALGDQQGRHLLLIGVGSGIAPLRAVVQEVLRHRDRFGDVVLLYGQRAPSEFAYREEFASWQERGVSVVPVLSDPGESPEAGRRGYVQHHVPHAAPHLLGPQTSALLCGMQAMIDQMVPLLVSHGVPRDRILLNH